MTLDGVLHARFWAMSIKKIKNKRKVQKIRKNSGGNRVQMASWQPMPQITKF
jgi:hypothetical protein